jgi:hypothetical protein
MYHRKNLFSACLLGLLLLDQNICIVLTFIPTAGTGVELKEKNEHAGEVNSVAFSSVGQTLCQDQMIILSVYGMLYLETS